MIISIKLADKKNKQMYEFAVTGRAVTKISSCWI